MGSFSLLPARPIDISQTRPAWTAISIRSKPLGSSKWIAARCFCARFLMRMSVKRYDYAEHDQRVRAGIGDDRKTKEVVVVSYHSVTWAS